jgi:hypothetical protein
VRLREDRKPPGLTALGDELIVKSISEDTYLLRVEGSDVDWAYKRFELVEPAVNPAVAKWDEIHSTLCSKIREAGEEHGFNICEEGLEEFCHDVGVRYSNPQAVRRAVFFVDLKPGSVEEQEMMVQTMKDYLEGQVEWVRAAIDRDECSSEWVTNPRFTDDDELSWL